MTAGKLIVQQIPIDEIDIGEHRRPIDEAAVMALAESIKEIGLRTPITVRREAAFTEDGKDDGEKWTLIAGRHRLEAARKLGWEHIDVLFLDTNDIDAELWEIAENLHRADLTKDQRDQCFRRWAELLEIQSRQSVVIESKRSDKKGHRQEGVASKIAKQSGWNKRTVERALAPQKPKVIHVSEVALTDEEVATQQHAALTALWNRTGELARQWFLEGLDRPIMDARHAPGQHDDDIPEFLRRVK